MITQHFKWLRKATDQGWRADIPSLNVVATSTVFQQDHNGYTHQDPGLLGHLVDKGLKIIDWASTDKGGEPDIVFASAGTEPTIESVAAISILHEKLPELKILPPEYHLTNSSEIKTVGRPGNVQE
ncbi:hypothetical protein PSTEL_26360 [Paenibacillus stellifer]|uniref:Uncharacterized protein n=1 Tax=Paenibacillus stellifer TaxID=169760 RepID=A0A089LYW7_9BACL|nr:hypothetical protein PSTEL_26360 [Paenibacillus stellifer]